MKKYKEKDYEYQTFYVFYGKDDKIVYCGTAKQLVEDGRYRNAKDVSVVASRINSGKKTGNFTHVCILKNYKGGGGENG